MSGGFGGWATCPPAAFVYATDYFLNILEKRQKLCFRDSEADDDDRLHRVILSFRVAIWPQFDGVLEDIGLRPGLCSTDIYGYVVLVFFSFERSVVYNICDFFSLLFSLLKLIAYPYCGPVVSYCRQLLEVNHMFCLCRGFLVILSCN